MDVLPKGRIVGHGHIDVAAVAAALPAGPCGSVIIKALAANAGTVYVGSSSVTTSNGFPLAAGDSISLFIGRLENVFVIAADANQDIRWLAISKD